MAASKRPSRQEARDNSGTEKGLAAGWDCDSDGPEELAGRRSLFFTLVAVVVLMGLWFLVTAVNSDGRQRQLTTTQGPIFAVKLIEFPASLEDRAVALMRNSRVRALAAGHEMRVVRLSGERCALCVGRGDRADSAELVGLLRQFQEFAENGQRPFASAVICQLSGSH